MKMEIKTKQNENGIRRISRVQKNNKGQKEHVRTYA